LKLSLAVEDELQFVPNLNSTSSPASPQECLQTALGDAHRLEPKNARIFNGNEMRANGPEMGHLRHHNESTPLQLDYPINSLGASFSVHPDDSKQA